LSTVATRKPLIPLLLVSAMFLAACERETRKQESSPRGSMQDSVQRNLAKDLEDDENGTRQLFLVGDEAVPLLIKFLSDPDEEKRVSAARGLAYIGNQQGMQALRYAVKSEQDKEAKSEMSYFLAGGLVEATSESDLNFLRSSVETARFVDDDDDESALPALSAALALGMMGRSDSLALLRKVAREHIVGSEEIAKAIRWIENKSIPRRSTARASLSEEELVKSVILDDTFFAEQKREETSVTRMTFNRERNRVLVSLEIHRSLRRPGSRRWFAHGYDLVLAKESGEWRVAGIWFAWIT
jgi:hypothetical protein